MTRTIQSACDRWRKLLARGLSRDERGQAYVEFVIVLPGLLLLVLLAWELAYFQWGRMVVSTATVEGTRVVATGHTPAEGYAIYDQIVSTGLGQLGRSGNFSLAVQPALRSVRSRSEMKWQWPTGLAGLMGGGLNLSLKSSSLFRLEEFWPGPPNTFE
jgi:Flp pilus assembly protein TadG